MPALSLPQAVPMEVASLLLRSSTLLASMHMPRGMLISLSPSGSYLRRVNPPSITLLPLSFQPDHHRYEDRSWLGLPYRVHFFHYHHREGEDVGEEEKGREREGAGDQILAATSAGTAAPATDVLRSSTNAVTGNDAGSRGGAMDLPGAVPPPFPVLSSPSPGCQLGSGRSGGGGDSAGSGGGGGSAGARREFVIWGLTASILVRVACVVYGRRAPFGEFHPEAPNYPTVLADLAKRRLFL